jgi:hypothetical protein
MPTSKPIGRFRVKLISDRWDNLQEMRQPLLYTKAERIIADFMTTFVQPRRIDRRHV